MFDGARECTLLVESEFDGARDSAFFVRLVHFDQHLLVLSY